MKFSNHKRSSKLLIFQILSVQSHEWVFLFLNVCCFINNLNFSIYDIFLYSVFIFCLFFYRAYFLFFKFPILIIWSFWILMTGSWKLFNHKTKNLNLIYIYFLCRHTTYIIFFVFFLFLWSLNEALYKEKKKKTNTISKDSEWTYLI